MICNGPSTHGEDGMPFVYDRTEIEWPEDDDEYEPPPPRPDDFMYLPPPEFGGAAEPVRFSGAESQQGAELTPVPRAPGGTPATPRAQATDFRIRGSGVA